ncbi:MAG TPA: L,D-transpeptidase [Nitrospiraceae bacterium]|nr:L,D-transpeptidase [Nitrospiraceae bacterium]
MISRVIERSTRSAASAAALAVTAIVAGLFAYQIGGSRDVESRILPAAPSNVPSLARLRAQHAALKQQLASYAPTGSYIVVDTARNRLYVKRRETVLLDAVVSTGSGTILDSPDQPERRWVFDTPRGAFAVQSKLVNPVWVKPDWAFLEEGRLIPANDAERVEAGILGEYAFGFGNGYFIHGTLYTRMLGRNVTHGCIRLNDDDLRTVNRLADIGTPLIIF